MIRDEGIRAERDLLAPARILAVGRRLDDLFLDAGPGRVRVAVDQPHDVGAVARRLAADHELDGLARLHAQVIGIADDAALDEVLGHLLPDAHVGALDRRVRGARARRLSRRLSRRRLRLEGDALTHNTPGGAGHAPCRTGHADGLQEGAPAHFGGLRRVGSRFDVRNGVVVVRSHS